MQGLCSEHKTHQVNFTDWVFFLPYNLMDEICPNSDVKSANTWPFISMG